MNFQGGGASCNPAPVRVFLKFAWLGLLESFLGDLFSQTRSLARYRFENNSPKNFVAHDRNNNVKNSSSLTVHSSLNNETNFSRFTSHFSLIKPSHFSLPPTPAFTLAEVLTTLGIIGIVAAMTLPSLINKAERVILAQQFKKSYANLQNAINLVQAEYGEPYECYALGYADYHTDQCLEFWPAVLSKMKVIAKCDGIDYDCHPKYKTKAEVLAQGGSVSNNSCSFNLKTRAINYYILYDGSYLILNDYSAAGHHKLYFAIDVNGKKGPNKWGYDVFYLNLRREDLKKNTITTSSVCQIKEKDGLYFSEIILK